MKVKKHFDNQAETYDSLRGNGILGKYVKNETNSVLEYINVNPGDNILDVGCGSGLFAYLFKERGANAYGIDISEKMIDQLHKKDIPGSVVDVQNFDLERKFEKILCAGVLEFVNDAEKSIICIKEHLADNGNLVILYPTNYLLGFVYKIYHFFNGINITLISKAEMKKMLNKHEFIIKKQKRVGLLSNLLIAVPNFN